MKQRPFKRGILNHCFQRSADGGVIFYSQSDYLIWFTTVCTAAARHQVKVLSMCPMPDHTHMSVTAESVEELSSFYGDANRTFSRAHNQVCKTQISWFRETYGSVPKKGAKEGRSNLIYVGNNPVERQLAMKAEDYRWTFLAYAVSDHPFSEKLVLRNASWLLRNAVREVRSQHKMGKPLTYNQLRRMISKLYLQEREQLIDFIITTYNVIDYKEALRYFDGSFENYLTALHSTTTHEYDLNETFEGRSDTFYVQMAGILMRTKKLSDIHEFLSWPLNERQALYTLLRNRTLATPAQVCKFLHIPLVKA